MLAMTFAFELIHPLVRWNDDIAATNVEIVLLLTLGLWGMSCLLTWRWPAPPPTLWLPTLAWMAVVVLSAALVFAWPPPFSHMDVSVIPMWRFVSRFVAGALLGWAAYDLAATPARQRIALRSLALAGLAVGMVGLAEAADIAAVTAWLSAFKYAQTKIGDVVRVSSTLGYATIASMVLELTLPLVIVWAATARHGWVRILLVPALVVSLAALVLTLTRAGVLAMLAALAVLMLAAWRRQERTLLWAGAASAALLLGLVLLALVVNPLTALRLVSETEQGWYRAVYTTPEEVTAQPGELLSVPVGVTNGGVRLWQGDGAQPFTLSYHLFRDGELYLYDGARSPLPSIVEPGATLEIDAQLPAPPEPGEYTVYWDMVQEHVTWFSWKSSPLGRTRLVVLDVAPVATTAIKDIDVRVPFAPVGRLALWRAAVLMAAQRPLLGIGPDNFRWLYGPFAGLMYWDTNIHTNNLYLEWLVDTGVVGLAVFLWFACRLAAVVGGSIGLWPFALENAAISSPGRSSPPRAPASTMSENHIWQIGLAAALAAWFVHGLFDFFYEFTPTYVAFWFVTGLAVRGSDVYGDEVRGCHADRL
jgi:hypothetical protein